MTTSEGCMLTSTAVLLQTPATGDTIRTASKRRLVTVTHVVMDLEMIWTAAVIFHQTASFTVRSMGW